MSNITIVLNKEGVDSLFPEGTEARVQLADAAVKAMVCHAFDKQRMTGEIKDMIDKAKAVAVREVAISLNMHVNDTFWQRLVLNDSQKRVIREAVQTEFAQHVADAAANVVKEISDSLKAQVDERVKYKIIEYVNTDMKNRVTEAITAALKP